MCLLFYFIERTGYNFKHQCNSYNALCTFFINWRHEIIAFNSPFFFNIARDEQ
jgi:hypothetical protein